MEWLWWTVGGCGALLFAAIILIAWIVVVDSRKRSRIFREGDHVNAWLVQANMKLFEKGFLDEPALVLISPDKETAADKDFMIELSERIMDLKGVDPDECDDKEEAYVAELMYDEKYIEGKRDKLPKGFADGRDVYLAHVMVSREHLSGGLITRRRMSCAVIWDDPTALICSCPALPATLLEDEDDGFEHSFRAR